MKLIPVSALGGGRIRIRNRRAWCRSRLQGAWPFYRGREGTCCQHFRGQLVYAVDAVMGSGLEESR